MHKYVAVKRPPAFCTVINFTLGILKFTFFDFYFSSFFGKCKSFLVFIVFSEFFHRGIFSFWIFGNVLFYFKKCEKSFVFKILNFRNFFIIFKFFKIHNFWLKFFDFFSIVLFFVQIINFPIFAVFIVLVLVM
jgi:hypothetical protein